MAHVQYTYMIAYVYHSLSLVLYDRLQGRTCLCTSTAGDLFVSWLLCTYNRDLPVSLSPESHMHLKCCICFRDRKKIPFSSSIVFARSLTCVFFSLSGKSQDSPNTAQGAEKCFLEGEKQSPFDADFFPLKKP